MKYKLLYRLKHMSFSTKAICLDLNIISDIGHFIALRGSFVQLMHRHISNPTMIYHAISAQEARKIPGPF